MLDSTVGSGGDEGSAVLYPLEISCVAALVTRAGEAWPTGRHDMTQPFFPGLSFHHA